VGVAGHIAFDARSELIGRTAELEAVDRWVAALRTEAAGLRIEGEPGIGKTSLWREALRRAEGAGARILRAAPMEPERSLTLGALTDLLIEVGTDELEALPAPQRHALEIALLRAEPSGQLPDQRTLSVATAGLLRHLATERPVVLAFDDVQWLDDASASILAYAIRRAVDRPIGVLVSGRLDGDVRADELLAGLGDRRHSSFRVGALPLAALHQLFLARFGRSFPRLALVRIEEASGGNPFYALEIARSVESAGSDTLADGRIPIPERLGSLLEARLAVLPAATRAALLLVALASDPSIEVLRRADKAAPDALAPAFDAGLATMGSRAVRFTHPLLGQAVIAGASDDAHRAAHLALAQAAGTDDARARHLAGATLGPDARVAAALETAAGSSRDRGATLEAAAMYEQAAALTPVTDPDGAMRRSRLAAETLFIDVSDYVQADRILEAAIPLAPAGAARAEALSLRGVIRYYHGQTPDAIRLGEQAMVEAGDDPVVRALVMGRAAFLVMQLDLERGHGIVAEALALLDGIAGVDPDLRANLLLLHASSELGLVRGYPADEVALGRSLGSPHARTWEHDGVPGIDYGIARQLDQLDRAIELTNRFIVEKAGPGGDDPFNLVSLSGLLVLRGDLDAAESIAQAAVEGYAHEGADVFPSWRLRGVALVEAHRGRLSEAERLANEGLTVALGSGDLALEVYHRQILGFVALSRGEARAAFEQLTLAGAAGRASGTRHPGRFKLEGDLVEAAIATGELEAARATVVWLEEVAAVAPTPWTRVMAARGRGLLHAVAGDLGAAIASYDRALDAHVDLPYPFERARTLLLAGTAHRRRKEKRLADERLREAIELFERTGAPVWAEHARAELARVGRRPRATADLTETEQRIAELAAEGLSARQIGERAFVAPKTASNVLGRVYAKLGIASRAELGAVMRDRAGGQPGHRTEDRSG
jgi:DNA-binding CsgD family transcriptional regulator